MKKRFSFWPLSFLLCILISLDGCKKENHLQISTKEASGGLYSVVYTGGIIQSMGKSDIIEKGVCWSTNDSPNIYDDTVMQGGGNESYICTVKGLSENTTYYFRAFARDNSGYVYGNVVPFTTKGLYVQGNGVTDFDGNHYQSVILGTQEWMTENLRVSHFQGGSPIPEISDSATWMTYPAAYCYYNNDVANDSIYGKLYNYNAIDDSRKLAPVGWHIPTLSDWLTLLDYLGGKEQAGGKMKEAGTQHWFDPNIVTTYSSGFNARPGGLRDINSEYAEVNRNFSCWTSTVYYPNQSTYTINIYNLSTGAFILAAAFRTGNCVRCVKD